MRDLLNPKERTRKMAKTEKSQKKGDLIHTSEEPHDLPCKLTTAERATAAGLLANAVENLKALEDEKKDVMADINARKKRLVKDLNTLSRHVKDGEATRSVMCELELNYNTLTATLTRKNTGEVVDERPMTEEEKQTQFDFDTD